MKSHEWWQMRAHKVPPRFYDPVSPELHERERHFSLVAIVTGVVVLLTLFVLWMG